MNINLDQIFLNALAIDTICVIILIKIKTSIDYFNWMWNVTAFSAFICYLLFGIYFMTGPTIMTIDPFRTTGSIHFKAIIVSACPGLIFCSIKTITKEIKWRYKYYKDIKHPRV